MVYCSLTGNDYSNPEKLKRFLLHLSTATKTVLENFIRKFGGGEQLDSLQTDFPQLQPNEYRQYLIDIYVDKLLVLEKIKREERANQIVEGRPDLSMQLQSVLKKDPWECPICFETYDDPQKIYVTCHREENIQRDEHAGTQIDKDAGIEIDSDKNEQAKKYCQHKACDTCSENLKTCHVCRADAERIPLSRIWNGAPVNMMMGGNPFLVDFSQ
jgi:hypothetical protein